MRALKTLLLNLPNKFRLTRRYMCSYNSPLSLLPPYELISMGGIVQEYGDSVSLIDAIAEKLSEEGIYDKIKSITPDLIITIIGFESYQEDICCINLIKVKFPDTKIVAIGHYPTLFYEQVLDHSKIDYIVLGEPDERFRIFYNDFRNGSVNDNTAGIAFKRNGKIVCINDFSRIKHLNDLPIPAHNLLPRDSYFEPLMPRPMGMIQSSRGCPYSCSYCVKSFGTSLSLKSPERVIGEIHFLIKTNNIRYLRFIDDTFTISTKRVIQICKSMISEGINIKWSCLSRTDNINTEVLFWMKKAGCKRIYFGIESGSQRILDIYEKKININEAYEALALTQAAGIETTGFFMMGFPEETWDDAMSTINFALKAPLNYAGVEPLIPYPGTAMFDGVKDLVDFNLFPYRCFWKDSKILEQYQKAEKEFYRRFYIRPKYIFNNIQSYALNPQSALPIIGRFASFMANQTDNIMNGIYYKRN